MLHSSSSTPSGQGANNLPAGDGAQGRLQESQLMATQNPALARLAGAVQNQAASKGSDYSRMHHRHNRS